MTDTPTPADVAEAADKLQSWLDGDCPMNVGAVETAIAALRSAPPAPGNGAAEMREAGLFAAKAAIDWVNDNTSSPLTDTGELGLTQCILAALHAPEVPEAVREWAYKYDISDDGSFDTAANVKLRDWIRKEYGL